MAFTNLTLFGVIPKGLMNTVSYGAMTLYMATRHVVLGIQPGKLGIQTASRSAIVLPGKSVMVDTARRVSLLRADALVVNTARRFVILQGA